MSPRVALWAAATLALVATASAEPTRLRVASEGARPPFNFLDSSNRLAGFEIDLMREICKRIDVECDFVTQDWESLIGGLTGGQYDLFVAAVEITDERLAKIAFSKPYAHRRSALIAPRDTPIAGPEPAALEGRRIGVEADSAEQAFFEDKYKKSELQRYATLEEAMLDLAEDRVDAVADDKLAASEFLASRKEGRCCRIIADLPADAAYFGAGLGVGLRKSDAQLKARIDSALDAMFADGTYQTIRARYFAFDIR
jgi:polar amino acid transport system substrate-binding protein